MGQTASQEVVLNSLNDIVTNIFVKAALNCNSDAQFSQQIQVECTSDATTAFENNQACRSCLRNVFAQTLSSYDRQEAAWKNTQSQLSGANIGVNKPIDEDFTAVLQAIQLCSKTRCKKCVVEDISQKGLINISLECESLQNIMNDISQSLTASLTQSLTNNQDVLGSLAQALSGDSTQKVVSTLVNRILIKLDTTTVSGLITALNQSQTVSVKNTSGGNSQIVNQITQSSAQTSAQTFLQKNQVFNTVLSQAEWDAFQTSQNSQDTIGELGAAAGKFVSIWTNMLSSITGVIFIALLGICGFLILFSLVWMVIKRYRNQRSPANQK